MTSIATKSFNLMTRCRNYSSPLGKKANYLGNKMKLDGFNDVVQRNFNDDLIALYAKNNKGESKLILLHPYGALRKTNMTKRVTEKAYNKEIDKAMFNEFDCEIAGLKRIKRFICGYLFDKQVEQRGWIPAGKPFFS